MNFNKLKYFIVVTEEQNITKAAKKLYISQPSLSQCIRSIELEMGIELLQRGKSKITLTHAGQLYYQWAKATLNSYHKLERDIAESKSGKKFTIAVGLSWQRSAFLLPDSLKIFYEKHPECTVKIHEDLGITLREMLEKNELDMILSKPFTESDAFRSVPIMQERLLLATGSKFELPHKEGSPFSVVDKQELVGQPIVILQEQQNIGKMMRQLLASINYVPTQFTECQNLETAHKLVRNNIGVSIFPEISVVCNSYPDVNYYLLNGTQNFRSICAVYHKDHPLEPEILSLISSIRQFLRHHDYPFLIGS